VGAYFAVQLEPRRRTDLFSNGLMAAVVDVQGGETSEGIQDGARQTAEVVTRE
jgi:hypothetical protein